jgi:hypothetical protein
MVFGLCLIGDLLLLSFFCAFLAFGEGSDQLKASLGCKGNESPGRETLRGGTDLNIGSQVFREAEVAVVETGSGAS